MSMLMEPSLENIVYEIGRAHKVRNFYNNLASPDSPNNYTTIDTHAVAASHLMPFSGKSDEVVFNFKGAKSAVTGLSGSYPLHHEAYVRAAKERGTPSRAM